MDIVLVPLLQSLREEDKWYQYVRPPVVHHFFLTLFGQEAVEAWEKKGRKGGRKAR